MANQKNPSAQIKEHQIKEQGHSQIFGLNVNMPVFVCSALITSISSFLVLIMPDLAAEFSVNLRNQIMSRFDWFFSLTVSIITLFIVLLGFPP